MRYRGRLKSILNLSDADKFRLMSMLSPEENARIGRMLKQKLMEAGLWGMFRNPLPICPPLSITKDEIDEIVSVFDRVIGEIEKEL